MTEKQGERWIVFYTDGSEFSHTDGSAWDCPRTGVQVIASSHPTRGYMMIYGADLFYYESDKGGWQRVENQMDLTLHLQRAMPPCVVFGEMCDDMVWRDLFKHVNARLVELDWRYVKPS